MYKEKVNYVKGDADFFYYYLFTINTDNDNIDILIEHRCPKQEHFSSAEFRVSPVWA